MVDGEGELLDETALAAAAEERTWQENEQRLAADRELVAELAADGFAGPRYERFEDLIARYALPVLRAWMSSGSVFRRTAARGFDLQPSGEEIDQLRHDSRSRDELANIVVAKALPWFRDHALVKGAWSSAGGACLTTYFMGSCLYFFPNELRAWRRDQQRRALVLTDDRDFALFAEPYDKDPGPEEMIVGEDWVHHRLSRADERIRPILALRLDGYSYEEIVELLDETSIRAVEGLVHRWRKKEQNELRGGGSDGRP